MILTMVLAVALVVCTFTDLRSRRIPNAVTGPIAAVGLVVNTLATCSGMVQGAVGLPSALMGMLACFSVMLVIHLLADHGAGDVKLSAAIGACVGVEVGLLCIVYAYIVAGLVAVAVLVTRFIAQCVPVVVTATLVARCDAHNPPATVPLADSSIPLAPCFTASWVILQCIPATGALSW